MQDLNINIKPNQTLKDFSYGRKFVKGMASRSIAPVILLEAFVESGRTYQAYKRGGYTEARERLTEEMIGALFWFSGVPLFNSLIDKYIGKKIVKLPETDFDTGKDAVRNPVKNYLKKFASSIKNFTKNPDNAEKVIAGYKFGKVMTSIILANCLVGLVLPKVNQGITKHIMKKQNHKNLPEQKTAQNQNTAQQYHMDSFINKNKDNVTFGAISPQTLMSLAYSFENNPKYGLLSTDMGVWIGRGACARNSHERTEVLFRDISSSYFYMFNMPVIAALLNKIQDGKKTRLDPIAAKQTTELLQEVLNTNKGTMSAEDFRTAVLGNSKNAESLITPEITKQLNDGKGTIKLNDFTNLLEGVKNKTPDVNIDKLKKLASEMADLQPELAGEKILTQKQVADVFTEGAINKPEFLKNIFRCSTSDQNLFTGKVSEPAFDKPLRFISKETFVRKQNDLKDYVEAVLKKANGKEITSDLLKKVCRENYIKNGINWGLGFVISAAFLSTFIPKIQYWITKKTTGSNAFPGTAEYKQADNNKK